MNGLEELKSILGESPDTSAPPPPDIREDISEEELLADLQRISQQEFTNPVDSFMSEKEAEAEEVKRRLNEIPFSIGFGDFKYTADETTWADIMDYIPGVDDGASGVAALVGWGAGMMDTIRGIKQLANVDVEEERQNEMAMRQLYSDEEYGTEAMVGLVGGSITDPAGLAMGVPLAKAASTIQKVKTLSNISKYGLAGSITGGVQTGTGYVDDESGISRPMLIGLGVVGGGVAGTIGGKMIDRAAAKELNTHLDNIRFFENEVARKVESGLTLNDAITSITKDMPQLKTDVDSAIRATGANPDFITAIRNAPINKATASGAVPVDGTSKIMRTMGNGVDKALGILSTRIRNFNERVAGKLRWYDAAVAARPEKYRKIREDFAKYFKTTTSRKSGKSGWTFNDNEVVELNRMLNKGDFEGVRSFIKFRRGDEAVQAFDKSLKVYKELGDELVQYGLLPKEKLVDNYWHIFVPRENMNEFMDLMKVSQPDIASQWEKRLANLNEASVRKNGHVLSEFQEGLAFQKFILGGADSDEIAVQGFLKSRKPFNWSPEMLRLQADPIKAMDNYIHAAVQEIEKAKFFGPDIYSAGYKGNKEGVFDLGAALDAYEANFMKGMDVNDQKELKELLRLRFGNAMVSANTATQVYKATINISLLGNYISALTQLGDIGVAMYKNGIRNTLRSALDVVNPVGAGHKNRITIEDMGLEQRFTEFEDISKTGWNKAQDFFFKASLFSAVDRLGKEAFVNSSLKKMTKIVNNPASPEYKAWVKKNQQFLGGDMQGVLDGFRRYSKTGNKEDLGDDALSYLFSELANIQPISKSEVPEFYLRSNMGKFIFTLKTFMLKQLDIIRNDGWALIKQGKQNGDKAMMAKGASNIVRYLGIVGSTNVAATHLKDLVSGKEDLENMLPEEVGTQLGLSALTQLMLANAKTFGADPYTLELLSKPEGLEQTTKELVLPPFPPLMQEAWSAMVNGQLTESEWKRLIGYFPLLGRMVNQHAFQDIEDRFSEGEGGTDRFSEGEPTDRFKQAESPMPFQHIIGGGDVSRFAEGGVVEDNPLKANEPPLTAAMEQIPDVPSAGVPAGTPPAEPKQKEPVVDDSTPTHMINNPDGTISTERSITVERNGKWFNVPTIDNGIDYGEKAEAAFDAGQIKPTGVFDTVDEATQAAQMRSEMLGSGVMDEGKQGMTHESQEPVPMSEQGREAMDFISDRPIFDAEEWEFKPYPSLAELHASAAKRGITQDEIADLAVDLASPYAKIGMAGITVAAKHVPMDLVNQWHTIMKSTNDAKKAFYETGLYLDPINKTLQFQIMPSEFTVKRKFGTSRLQDVVEGEYWDDVFQLAPELKGTRISFDSMKKDQFGYYDVNNDTVHINKNLSVEKQKSAIVHEVQHSVQRWHDMINGADPQQYDWLLKPDEAKAIKDMLAKKELLQKDIDRARARGDFFELDNRITMLTELDAALSPLEKKAFQAYESRKGEVEARYAQELYESYINFMEQAPIYQGRPKFSEVQHQLAFTDRLPTEGQKQLLQKEGNPKEIWDNNPQP